MSDSLQLFAQADPLGDIAIGALVFVAYVVLGLAPVCGVTYLIYFLLTLPMRRNERARVFLDLLELGLKEGRTPEVAIAGAAASRDRSLGARFHLLAGHLGQGLRLSEALELVPRVLTPQLRAMLKTGERIGDVAKVLPACRQLLKDGVSQVRGALNYLILLVFAVTPVMIFVPLILRIKVMPTFNEVFEGMLGGQTLPAFTRLVFAASDLSTLIQVGILGLVWLAVLAYLGGPRLHGWLHSAMPGAQDWILCRLPWRRKRLQRDFSTMLAMLLDAEVPEVEAVTLAAEATGNVMIAGRARKVGDLLKEGVKLPEAIRVMDDSRELQWRLTNALRRGGGFLRALSGWHEALDARAFQLEQAAAQITTTVLVLFNGLVVASIVIAVFLVFIQLVNEAVLW
jgi:type IV pilus assembly protein PilC